MADPAVLTQSECVVTPRARQRKSIFAAEGLDALSTPGSAESAVSSDSSGGSDCDGGGSDQARS